MLCFLHNFFPVPLCLSLFSILSFLLWACGSPFSLCSQGPWTDSWEPPAHWEIQYVRLYPPKSRLGCFYRKQFPIFFSIVSHPSDQRVHLAAPSQTPPSTSSLGGSWEQVPAGDRDVKDGEQLGNESRALKGRERAAPSGPTPSSVLLVSLPGGCEAALCGTSAHQPTSSPATVPLCCQTGPEQILAKFCWPPSGHLYSSSHGLQHPSLHSGNYTQIWSLSFHITWGRRP